MVVLGFQLVSTLIGASLLSKLSSHFSFGQWLLCNKLIYYLYPTDQQLKELAGISTKTKDKNKRLKRQEAASGGGGGGGASSDGTQNSEQFLIPKSTPIELDANPLKSTQVIFLKYYWEYQWIMDFTLCSLLIYLVSECAQHILWGTPTISSLSSATTTLGGPLRMNLSLLWLIVAIFLGIKSLLSIAWIYLRVPEQGEFMILLTFTFFFFVLAMGILLLPEQELRLDLFIGHANFTQGIQQYWLKYGSAITTTTTSSSATTSPPGISLTTIKIFLLITCALIGGLLTYPGLRLAKSYQDAQIYASNSSLITLLLLHLHFFLPSICLLFWLGSFRDQILQRLQLTKITQDDLHVVGFYVIVFFCFLRLLLFRTHIQAYLHLARSRIVALRKEAGRISNVEIKQTVWSVFRCLAIVCIQYIVPIQILFMTACLYKTLGGIPWLPPSLVDNNNYYFFSLPLWPKHGSGGGDAVANSLASTLNENHTNAAAADPFALAWWLSDEMRASVEIWSENISQFRGIFTPLIFRTLFGFYLFWTLLCIQLTSLFGLFYHSYAQS